MLPYFPPLTSSFSHITSLLGIEIKGKDFGALDDKMVAKDITLSGFLDIVVLYPIAFNILLTCVTNGTHS